MFVLPMCSINYKSFPNNFINCYINDSDEIIAVFNIPEIPELFKEFLSYIEDNKNYTKYEEDIDEISLYFTIPNECKENYNLFLKGKYSKFTESYKQLLCEYYGRISRRTDYKVNLINVIYPEKFKKQQIADNLGVNISLIEETLDRPDLTKEIYKSINQLKKQTI